MPELPTIDTSSYKQALPTSRNPLDTAQQLGGMEQQKIQIDQQKLKLMNDRFMIINNELSTLANDPSVSREKIISKMNLLSKMGLVPKEQLGEFAADIPNDPKNIKVFVEQTLQRGMSVLEKQQFQYGQREQYDTGQQIVPRYESPRFGAAPPIQKQEPPTMPYTDPETGLQKTIGPQPPVDVPRGAQLPVGRAAPVTSAPIELLPVAPQQVVPATPIRSQRQGEAPIEMGIPGQQQPPGMPTVSGPVPRQPQTGLPAVGPPQRQGGGFVTSLAPGEKEVMESSAKSYVEELNNSKNYQNEIYPLKQAIGSLERLGTTGTGPGTETIQLIKSFLLSNVGGTGLFSKEQIDRIQDFDEAHKYLIDYVNQTSNRRTNDILAAALAGNANVHISNAAAIDVAKSALALRNQKQIMTLEFQKSGLPAQQFSKWATQWTNTHDPRGFAVGMMTDDAKSKLREKLEKAPKKEKEAFLNSARLANELGY